jgi:hypothetical protein
MRPFATKIQPALWVLFAVVGSGVSVASIGGGELYPLRIAALMVAPILFVRLFNVPITLRPSSLAAWTLLATITWGAFSLLWSPDPQLGLRSLLILTTGATLTGWIILYATDNRDRILLLLKLWASFSLLTSSLGLYELLSGSHIAAPPLNENTGAIERFTLTNGWLPPRVFNANWNNFAFTNGLTLVTMIGVFCSDVGRATRAIAAVSASMLFVLVAASFSRAAVAGTAASLALYLAIVLGRPRRVCDHRRNSLQLIMIGGLCCALAILPLFISRQSFQLLNLLFDKHERFDGFGVRTEYYKSAVRAAIDSGGLGAGLGASSDVINGGSYHHHFLELLAELGIFVFFIHVFLHVSIATKCLKGNQGDRLSSLLFAVVSTVVALPIFCIGPSSVICEPVYWLWLGVSSSLSASQDTAAHRPANKAQVVGVPKSSRTGRTFCPMDATEAL